MATREQKLLTAVDKLAKYYGLYTTGDLARQIATEVASGIVPGNTAQNQIEGQSSGNSGGASEPANNASSSVDNIGEEIIKSFINDSDGSYTVSQLAEKFSSLLANAPEEQQRRFGKLIEIYGDSSHVIGSGNALALKSLRPARTRDISINGLLGISSGQNSVINSQPDSPDKEHPALSIIFSNTKKIAQTNKHANAVSLFLNGIPNLEISKAVPYLDVQFLFSRAPVDPNEGRLQTPSLVRFLYGATPVPGALTGSNGALGAVNPMRSMALGNSMAVNSVNGRDTVQETFTAAGMEMFTAPQTLINANERHDPAKRTVPVLDKFRSFLTMKDFEIEIRGTTGVANFKTGKLTFILHDRSRMSEIAELIKPDLYGTTELLIEYGWSHPDGERRDSNNLYGDIINGMRCKEKWGISNSSFTFEESGQVNISLSLFTKAGIDLTTSVISANDEGEAGNVIRAIEYLQRTIADIRARSYPNQTQSANTQEIRGVQILEASQDAMSFTILSSELQEQLRKFRNTLRSTSHGLPTPQLTELKSRLDELFGTDNEIRVNRTQDHGTTARAGGRLGALRRSIVQSIQDKVRVLTQRDVDPFLIESRTDNRPAATSNQTRPETRAEAAYIAGFGVDAQLNKKISLASLMLQFVGQPLAVTKQYDDVQLIFYPFNSYAGFANNLNIGNFEVDAKYFVTELARLRLSTIGRSSNMNLREFLNFVGQTIIDDPAAPSYGLWDEAGAFNKRVVTDGARSTNSVYEPPILQARMDRLLKNRTPDGTFKMPQVEFFVECLPGKIMPADGVSQDGNREKSILKIHVFDRVATPYDTLGAILSSARNQQLEAVGDLVPSEDGNESVRDLVREDAARAISAASNFHLIEPLPANNNDPTIPRTYRIIGGPEHLRNFLYQSMPYIIYGAGGTLVKQANLSSMQNAALATVNLVRSARKTELEPNGEQPGGLPIRIIPTELTLDTYGCPLLVYTQQFFVDFQTGTTADNIYGISGISHRISEGDFSTSIKFTPFDAYGKYEGFLNRIKSAQAVLADAIQRNGGTDPPAPPRSGT